MNNSVAYWSLLVISQIWAAVGYATHTWGPVAVSALALTLAGLLLRESKESTS
jgi:hypothetical protein